MNLTIQEINQLLEALRVWESEPAASGLSASMMSIMLGGGKDDDRSASERRMNAIMEKAKQSGELRRDQSILIQAKLIQARNELTRHTFLETEHA